MNKLVLALTTASLLALTACGGGGDDSPQVNQSVNQGNNTPPVTPPNTDPNAPFTMKEQIKLWKSEDYSLSFKGSPTTQKDEDKTRVTLATLKIGNKEIHLLGSNYTVPQNGTEWKSQKSAGVNTVFGADTAYARYGFIALDDTKQLGLFYQGIPTSTQDMEKLKDQATSPVTYKGQAYAVKQDVSTGTMATGVSNFTVDFKGKKLTGTLDNWHNAHGGVFNKVNIDAKIQANTFQGTANKTGTAEGKFYGSNATELAGAFTDNSQKVHGVFSGKKQ